ncbi:MAG: transposase [Planctomycetota bacterium]
MRRACLAERGLKTEHGLLCIIDGAKGLRKAVNKVFGDKAAVQRGQWHKRENVVRYLPTNQQAAYRRKLQAAYEQPTYAKAKAALGRVRSELTQLNATALLDIEPRLRLVSGYKQLIRLRAALQTHLKGCLSEVA